MSWTPEDNFYPGYSIFEDFGITNTEEKQRIEKILQHDNLNLNDSNIRTYMELSRELMLFLSDECKEELQEFSEYLRKEKYVGTTLPIELILSQIIISEFIPLALKGIKDLVKKIKEYLKKRKDERNIREQTEIILKIIKKIEKKGKIVENFEVSVKKITNKE